MKEPEIYQVESDTVMQNTDETPKKLGVRGTGEKFARFMWASLKRLKE